MVEELPIAPDVAEEAARLGVEPAEACFYGGEEYELVLTVKPDAWEEAVEAAERASVELKRIGRATREPGLWLRGPDGKLRPLEARGWEHFRA